MNVVFTLKKSSWDEKFLDYKKKTLKSVDGFRGSICTELTVENVLKLSRVIRNFAEVNKNQ